MLRSSAIAALFPLLLVSMASAQSAPPLAPAASEPPAPSSTPPAAPATAASSAPAPAAATTAPPSAAPSAPADTATAATAAHGSTSNASAPDSALKPPSPARAHDAETPAASLKPVSDEPSVDDGLLGTHQLHLFASAGYRGSLIRGDGFDLFSHTDALHQASLSVGDAFYAADRLSFAAALNWDYGERRAELRGSGTNLSFHRVTLAPEARYHILRRLYAFGRVGAGLAVVEASWSDPIGGDRESNHLAFTADPSIGAALELMGESAGRSQRPRLWLLADAGYLLTSSVNLDMKSTGNAPARTNPIGFGDLALSGFTFRVFAAVSY